MFQRLYYSVFVVIGIISAIYAPYYFALYIDTIQPSNGELSNMNPIVIWFMGALTLGGLIVVWFIIREVVRLLWMWMNWIVTGKWK